MTNPVLLSTQEVTEGLITPRQADARIRKGSLALLKGTGAAVLAGPSALVKVNTSIGCNHANDYATEVAKVEHLGALGYRPDLVMDLSTVRLARPLYVEVQDVLTTPVGTLPHYLCYTPRRGVDAGLLMEEVERQAEAGVSWLTLHLSVTRELYELAVATRRTPTTARGGGIVIRDMLIRGTSESILAERFPEILSVLHRHGMGLSLGTSFRPANTVDAMDAVHVAEIRRQGVFVAEASRAGVGTMLESVGHMRLKDFRAYVRLLRRDLGFRGPLMPLGPIPTDAAVGEDHIANALGAGMLAFMNGADIINSVTREEHTGNVPDLASISEGLRAARISAHAVNISRFPSIDWPAEQAVVDRRDANYTCVVDGGLFTRSATTRFAMGCTRCGNECPLVVNFVADRDRQGQPVQRSVRPAIEVSVHSNDAPTPPSL